MTVHDPTPRTDHVAAQTGPAHAASPKAGGWRERRRRRRQKPKLRRLRVIVVLGSVVTIAIIAFLFGVLTSVASDLHGLSNQVQFNNNVDSVLYDDTGAPIGVLAPPNKPVMDKFGEISPNMVHAIVSVEDKNFWTDPGIDLKSLGRAFLSDVTGGPTEGASTIAEEFVKNVEQEEDHRTVLEKLREAGLAFQLVHQWKRAKILAQYLNVIYFGNGAYGIEAAARYYFGKQLGYDPSNPSGGKCGTATVARKHLPSCASLLRPYQAAMLAAMVANPTAFNPLENPKSARARRNAVVLRDMLQQGYINHGQYAHAVAQPVPITADVEPATEPAAAPYFTSWVRPQIVRALEKEGLTPERAQYEAFYGGLKVKLTINLKLQQAAQQAITAEFGDNPNGPTAALVSIDNATGEVRAMVSGNGDYQSDPFNLATLGYRQPGSSFKVFTLVQALESGKYGPDSIIDSAPQDIPFTGPHGEPEHFIVHNDEDNYNGPMSLAAATAYSDNTVFAQVGMSLGTKNIARQAHLLGIRSPISTNPAMIIGGLKQGVSVLDMTHAYETLATGGAKVSDPVLGDVDQGAVGIHSIQGCRDCRSKNITNRGPLLSKRQVVPADDVAQIQEMLAGVVSHGTGTAAAIPGVVVVGKTGTTTNYVDAWFCGWTSQLTTCVWVGYPNSGKPMTTDWNGGPVMGGTYPAVIWHNYTELALNVLADESAAHATGASTAPSDEVPGTVPDVTAEPTTAGADTTPSDAGDTNAAAAGATTTPADTGATAGTGDNGATQNAGATGATAATTPAVATPTPVTPAATTPAATPTPAAPSTGGSSTSGGAGLGG
jgi:penicillin-binding protein 1A